MNATPWHVRPYRPGDERALASLWTAAFGRPMTPEYWLWKCKGRSSSVENVGVAAGPGDQPIGQFVGIPCGAVVLGSERQVMVGADVVTAPEFRRRGVFTATARRLFDGWREAGVALVLGLANDRWGSRAAALGYERYFKLRWLMRLIRPERVLARRARLPGLARWQMLGRLWNRLWSTGSHHVSDVTLRVLESPTDDIDAIWTRSRVRAGISLVKDRAWVAWRYFGPPQGGYHVTLAERGGMPVGWSAYRVVREPSWSRAYIADVFAPGDSAALGRLVRDVVARVDRADVDAVVSLAVPGSETYRELRRAGFVFSSGAYKLEAVRLDQTIPAARLGDPRVWWLAGGDFDVV